MQISPRSALPYARERDRFPMGRTQREHLHVRGEVADGVFARPVRRQGPERAGACRAPQRSYSRAPSTMRARAPADRSCGRLRRQSLDGVWSYLVIRADLVMGMGSAELASSCALPAVPEVPPAATPGSSIDEARCSTDEARCSTDEARCSTDEARCSTSNSCPCVTRHAWNSERLRQAAPRGAEGRVSWRSLRLRKLRTKRMCITSRWSFCNIGRFPAATVPMREAAI